ncbi:MAG: site-specific integrase [Gemmatimonadetes bacterium]|nr:site-specific integrase [Gemmatimonadota bacterium]
MHLFVWQSDGWNLSDGTPVTRALTEAAGLKEGVPIFITAMGRYDEHLNAWVQELSLSAKAKSPYTWYNYAHDVRRFVLYLAHVDSVRGRVPRPWFEATEDDLFEYHGVRQDQSGGDWAVSGPTWNRELSALHNLFAWAKRNGLVQEMPFRIQHREIVIGVPAGHGHSFDQQVTVSQDALAAKRSKRPPKYLEPHEWADYLHIGLGGMTLNPDREARVHNGARYVPDPTFRGRMATRNTLFAKLLVSTGMRRSEANSLLRCEVPDTESVFEVSVDDAGGAPQQKIRGTDAEIMLATAAVKGRTNPRPVYIPRGLYRRLQRYVKHERAHAVALRRAGADGTGEYQVPDRGVVVEFGTRGTYTVPAWGPKPRAVDASDPQLRRLLYERHQGRVVGPAQLWVGEHGLPLSEKEWNSVFEAANARCSAILGRPVDVNPHDMRHTYAIHFLQRCIEALLERTEIRRAPGTPVEVTRRIYRDPLDLLRQRLGHQSLESTWIYLQHLEEVQDLANDAMTRFARDFGLDDD